MKIEVRIGDEVVVCRLGSWDIAYEFGWKVIRVTPKGQIIVQTLDRQEPYNQIRFNAEGKEIGETYHPRWLDVNVQGIREGQARLERSEHAATAIEAVKVQSSGTYSKERLQAQINDLRKLLDEAQKAVDLI